MHAVSDAFATAIVQSHRMAVLVEVLQDEAVIATLSAVTEGSVTLDAKAQIRGRLDLSIVDDGTQDLVPTGAGDLLAPYGNELRISRGIQYPNASIELVPLGVFRINDTDVDDSSGSRTIKIAGMDRAARVADARFEAPYQIAAGTNVATAILTVLQDGYAGVVTDFVTTPHTTGEILVEEGADRWDLAQKLAKNAALELYFDGDGTAVLRAEAEGGAAISLTEGVGGVLIAAGRSWSRQGAFNRVIATGENTGVATPVRGVATDDNPLSPTYYFGPFGQAPRFYSSPFLTTTAQAQDAAQAILARELGTTQSVRFGTLVLPHLEPSDVARITRVSAGIDEDHIIDSLTIPLSAAGQMTGATRASQVIA